MGQATVTQADNLENPGAQIPIAGPIVWHYQDMGQTKHMGQAAVTQANDLANPGVQIPIAGPSSGTTKTTTYNIRDSPVVTYPSTSLTILWESGRDVGARATGACGSQCR
jgi:hypothetical protein